MSRSSIKLLERLATMVTNRTAIAVASSGKVGSFRVPSIIPPLATYASKEPVQRFSLEVDDIFRQNSFALTQEELLRVSAAVQKIIEDANLVEKSKVKEIDIKPFTQDELAKIVGESFATINLGAKEEERGEVLVFGFGNMARAIASGFHIKVQAVINDESKPRFGQEGVVIDYVSKTSAKYQGLFAKDKVHQDVILSVKPQVLGDIVDDLSRLQIAKDAMVISVMAGVSTNILRQIFLNTKILRVMPNTPLAQGYGVAGIFLPEDMQDKKSAALEYFGFGNNLVVFVSNEEQINAITGVSGSGPAYFFMIAEECAKASSALGEGMSEKKIFDIMRNAFSEVDIASYEPKNLWNGSVKDMVKTACASDEQVLDFILSFTKALYEKSLALGFSAQDAKTLAVGTAIGAGQYGFKSKDSAETLRKNVTSPKGTTYEALQVFEKKSGSLDELVGVAVQAATDRAVELGIEVEKKFFATCKVAAVATAVSFAQSAPLAANCDTKEL